MTATVRISEPDFAALTNALDRAEEVVFAFANYSDGTFDVTAIEAMTGTDVESRSDFHVTLADEVRPRLIKAAADRGQCLIEAHSHGPFGYAEFSPTDLRGFDEWVPHVRWRLGGRPYAALVLAGDTWDALAWIDGPSPTTVAAIKVTPTDGATTTITPTNATASTTAAKDAT